MYQYPIVAFYGFQFLGSNVVFCIVIITSLIWLPPSLFVAWLDRKFEESLETKEEDLMIPEVIFLHYLCSLLNYSFHPSYLKLKSEICTHVLICHYLKCEVIL